MNDSFPSICTINICLCLAILENLRSSVWTNSSRLTQYLILSSVPCTLVLYVEPLCLKIVVLKITFLRYVLSWLCLYLYRIERHRVVLSYLSVTSDYLPEYIIALRAYLALWGSAMFLNVWKWRMMEMLAFKLIL